MEAPEHRERVRPLPPEGETGEFDRAQPMRALLPLLGGGLILVVFIAIITLGSSTDTPIDAGAGDTASTSPTFVRPTDPTTTIAVPTTIVTREAPELIEVLPEFVGGMNAVVEHDDGTVVIARWRLNRRFPQFTDLLEGPGHTALDASGQVVATLGLGTLSSNSRLLSVGPVPVGTKPVFVAAKSFAWHSATPGLLAVTGRQPADESDGVFVLQFDGSGALQSVRRVADAGPTWVVTGFHEAGIAILDNDQVDPVVRILDRDGFERATTSGTTHITTDEFIIGLERSGADVDVTTWSWDLAPLDESPRYLREGFDVPEIVSPNGRHGAEIVRAQTSTVAVRSSDISGPRSVGIQAPIAQAFFITNDHIAAFSSAESTLFIIEWRTGIIADFELEGMTLRSIAAPGYEPVVGLSSFMEPPPDEIADTTLAPSDG